MVKIIAVHTRDVRAHGWGNDRTASSLQQFSLTLLKSNSEMKLELNVHRLLRSFLSCSALSNLCSAGERHSLTWEVMDSHRVRLMHTEQQFVHLRCHRHVT